jgi:hypothetical protein
MLTTYVACCSVKCKACADDSNGFVPTTADTVVTTVLLLMACHRAATEQVSSKHIDVVLACDVLAWPELYTELAVTLRASGTSLTQGVIILCHQWRSRQREVFACKHYAILLCNAGAYYCSCYSIC